MLCIENKVDQHLNNLVLVNLNHLVMVEWGCVPRNIAFAQAVGCHFKRTINQVFHFDDLSPWASLSGHS